MYSISRQWKRKQKMCIIEEIGNYGFALHTEFAREDDFRDEVLLLFEDAERNMVIL